MTITIESPLKIRRRLRAAFSPATMEEHLIQLKEKANTSLMALEYLNETPCLNLVRFYQIVSPWCDRSAELYELERKLARIDYGQYLKDRQALVSLAAQEERDLYGVNQTLTGQVPSMDTTLLGGYRCCGLTTRTVSYWESKRDKYTNELALIGQPDSPTIMEVIDNRASELLNNGLVRWKSFLQDLINS